MAEGKFESDDVKVGFRLCRPRTSLQRVSNVDTLTRSTEERFPRSPVVHGVLQIPDNPPLLMSAWFFPNAINK